MMMAVGEVAEADAHIVIQRAGNGDGDGDAKDCVGYGRNIKVTVAQKNEAGGVAPEKG